jgi:Amt family ammonium transporter
VAVTASCNNIEPWASFVIGMIGAFAYEGACKLIVFFKVDDPVEASPLHAGSGFVGVICVGLFDLVKKFIIFYFFITHL